MRKIPKKGFVPLFLVLLGVAGCSDDSSSPPDPVDEAPTYEDVTVMVGSGEYINNRFFFLDLPNVDEPGRDYGWEINHHSIRVYQFLGDVGMRPGDIENVAVYEDTTGIFWSGLPDDFANPYLYGLVWCPLALEVMLDIDGNLVAIDLRESVDPTAVLAVAYQLRDRAGEVIKVGDLPGIDEGNRQEIDGEPYYRMKLLKAPESDRHAYSFDYVLRNIYPLGDKYINAEFFDLVIERTELGADHPDLDEAGIPYIRVFGLDNSDGQGGPPDGLVDKADAFHFDLVNGLLKFPLDFPRPFAADEMQYRDYVNSDDFIWDGTYLADHLVSEIYEPGLYSTYYPDYSAFQFRISYRRNLPEQWTNVPLTRTSWSWASVPLQERKAGGAYTAESRVEAIRWYSPKERVKRYYLDPSLSGSAREATVAALELYMHADPDNGWSAESWGGIMLGNSPFGVDLSDKDSFRFWINDSVVDSTMRSGTLHFDFGQICEDGFWPRLPDGGLETGTWQREDGILDGTTPDGVWFQTEDVGLDGNEWGWQRYDAAYDYDGDIYYPGPDSPYPGINGTARNNREDTEDLNGNTMFETRSAYFTIPVPLRDPAAVDVLRDYADTSELVAAGLAWRQYEVPLSAAQSMRDGGDIPDLSRITHVRIWFEDEQGQRQTVRLQFAGLEFVQSEKNR
jgi:hypothetical protein